MGAAFRTDGFTAEWTVIDSRDHLMGAVAVIEGAHDLNMFLPAVRARILVHDKVAGKALVFALALRNIVEALVFFCQFLLIRTPIHTITSHTSLINF